MIAVFNYPFPHYLEFVTRSKIDMQEASLRTQNTASLVMISGTEVPLVLVSLSRC